MGWRGGISMTFLIPYWLSHEVAEERTAKRKCPPNSIQRRDGGPRLSFNRSSEWQHFPYHQKPSVWIYSQVLAWDRGLLTCWCSSASHHVRLHPTSQALSGRNPGLISPLQLWFSCKRKEGLSTAPSILRGTALWQYGGPGEEI
ncbi:hypothetical protein KIL84_016044 [Mauremys mutica]|uniref:Uncharacterized protein n=1 Tax=Mauremys mutica TaxID=74926 RepID=A0A9D4AMF6_9SAUR|nr:hypothetical protein KIL84_016044 [Mauremys mutica]